ncbi:hypothetical protein SAY87_012070 [Trapa incisa]|uniref:Uncharacterized protein n=1 Tax=Trapa incisa TaxID=236973 RepID=A0AAN7GRP9_9MYRT|nr:hypothetical protein SAY87_012070 [Trapa incisa]
MMTMDVLMDSVGGAKVRLLKDDDSCGCFLRPAIRERSQEEFSGFGGTAQTSDDMRKQPGQGSLVETSRSSKKDFEQRNPTEDQLRLNDNEDDRCMINGLTGNNPLSTTTGSPNNMQANNEWTSMQPQKFLAPSVEKEPLGFTISTNTETAATAKMAGKTDMVYSALSCMEDISHQQDMDVGEHFASVRMTG